MRNLLIRELLELLDDGFLGPSKWIYCYLDEEGGCPSRRFLDDLNAKAAASYAKSFQYHCQGATLRGDRWRPWTEKDCRGIYEYKDNPSQTRLIHLVEVGHIHVLLFGFGGKKENKVKNKHVLRAQRMRDEYIERRARILARLKGER